jgi:hypothetical protein
VLAKHGKTLVISLVPTFVSIEEQRFYWAFLFDEDLFRKNLIDMIFLIYMGLFVIYFIVQSIWWTTYCRYKKQRKRQANLPRVRSGHQNVKRTVPGRLGSRSYDSRRARRNGRPLFEMDLYLYLTIRILNNKVSGWS